MHYLVLVILVSTVSCGVIRTDRTQSEDQVEIMKREENPDSLLISFDKNLKIPSESLVQGISDADLESAMYEIKRQGQALANEINREFHIADILRNSAQTSSISTRVILGTVIMITVKMMI